MRPFQSLLCWITQSFPALETILHGCWEVSIPVVLDHPVLQAGRGAAENGGSRVSIPVVLDHPVLPPRPKRWRRAASSFNPCCVGSPSPSLPIPPPCTFLATSFNPCCVGSPSPSPGYPAALCPQRGMFQSLLCWITQSFSAPVSRLTLAEAEVSIPVVLDHPVLRPCIAAHACGGGGFNPCCVGSPSPSWRRRTT